MLLEDLFFLLFVVRLDFDQTLNEIGHLEWGSDNPFFWEVNVANSWRTTQGSPSNWQRMLYNIDIVRSICTSSIFLSRSLSVE